MFFPYCKEQEIDEVIIAGDLFDRRKFVNIATARAFRERFWEPLVADFKKIHLIAGNHDVYHSNSLVINALDELCLRHFIPGEQFASIEATIDLMLMPQERLVGSGLPVLFVPWMCSDNEAACWEAIENSNSPFCVGHFHFQGFDMGGGRLAEDGIDHSLLSKFELVLTGHFHHMHQKANVLYLGSPYQMTWADWDDPRGFHVLDTTTRKLKFVPNPQEMFHKVVYDDSSSLENLMSLNFEKYKGTYVRVMPQRRENPVWFDMFVDSLEKVAAEVRIIEPRKETLAFSSANTQDMETLDILRNSVEEANVAVDKARLDKFLVGLYNEALMVES